MVSMSAVRVTTMEKVEYKPDIDFSVFCSLEHMGILKEELMNQDFTSNYIDKITRNAILHTIDEALKCPKKVPTSLERGRSRPSRTRAPP